MVSKVSLLNGPGRLNLTGHMLTFRYANISDTLIPILFQLLLGYLI